MWPESRKGVWRKGKHRAQKAGGTKGHNRKTQRQKAAINLLSSTKVSLGKAYFAVFSQPTERVRHP